MWPLTGSRARPDATVRWRKRTQIAGAWFPAEPCEEELEAGRAIRAEPEPGYFFVFGQPVTVVRPGPVGSAPGVQVPVRCHAGDFLKQIDQNA